MGLRSLWEAEESRRRRVEPEANQQRPQPDWIQQYGDRGMQIGSAGAEEARQEGRRASGIVADDYRQQGETVGQGLQNIGEKAVSGYKAGRELSMAEEQRQEQRQAAGLARERAQLEQQYLPGQLEQQRELGRAQLDQTRTTTDQQRIALEMLQARNAFAKSMAAEAGLPGAREDESVAMYEMRMEQEGKVTERDAAKLAMEEAAFRLANARDLAPMEKEQLRGQIAANAAALEQAELQKRLSKLDIYERQRGINVRSLASELSMAAQSNALQAKADEMIRDGIPRDTVGEALQQVKNNQASADQQRLVMEQLDPNYQRMLARQDKADKYSQAIAILQQNEKYLGGFGTPGSAQEQQSISSIQMALEQIGMTDLAKKVGQSLTMQGLSPTTRKTLVNDIIKRIHNQFEAELSAGGVPESPGARRIYQNIKNMFMSTQMGVGPKGNPFIGTAPGLDFSDGGI
jgi:hypothetical protein